MKKYFFILLIIPLLTFGAHTAFAQSCPTGFDSECPGEDICNTDTKQCITSTDKNYDTETSGIGDACGTSDDNCRGSTTQCVNGKCQYDPNATPPAGTTGAPAAGATTPGATTPAAGVSTYTAGGNAAGGNFIPLTQLPGLKDIAESPNISAFLNTLYKLCIGAAATIAVLQIMRAGLLWMGAGDNAENITKAKGLISTSIFGLILVLSPFIVFSIINPAVLNISFKFDGLGVAAPTPAPAAPANTPANPPPSIIQSTGEVNPACKPFKDGDRINSDGGSQENQDSMCCQQQSRPGGIQCVAGPDPFHQTDPQRYCHCQ